MATKEPPAPLQVVSLERLDLLSAPKRSGFHRRWARNTDEDIERLRESGYVVVKNEDGGPKTRRDMVLVEVPQAIYDERTRMKVARVYAKRRAARQSAASESERMARQPEHRGVITVVGDVSVEGGESRTK